MDKYKLPCLHAKCKNLLTTAQKYNNTHTYKEMEESSGNYLYISHLKVQYLLEFLCGNPTFLLILLFTRILPILFLGLNQFRLQRGSLTVSSPKMNE